MGSLPALRQGSEACVVTTTEPKPIAEQGAETAPRVAAALDAEEPHTVLAPRGSQAAADARTIGWRQKETATASKMIPLQGAGTAERARGEATRDVLAVAPFDDLVELAHPARSRRAGMAMFRGNYHRTGRTKVEGHGRRGNRGMASASGSIAGEDAAPRMAQLGSSRRAAAHAASAPPPRRLRASAAAVEVLGVGLASLAACQRLVTGSIAGDDAACLGWRNLGPAHGFTPAHQPLHRAGDAGGHDLKTTSWLCHTSAIHDPGQRMECPVSL